jgi:hypothetical protein
MSVTDQFNGRLANPDPDISLGVVDAETSFVPRPGPRPSERATRLRGKRGACLACGWSRRWTACSRLSAFGGERRCRSAPAHYRLVAEAIADGRGRPERKRSSAVDGRERVEAPTGLPGSCCRGTPVAVTARWWLLALVRVGRARQPRPIEPTGREATDSGPCLCRCRTGACGRNQNVCRPACTRLGWRPN